MKNVPEWVIEFSEKRKVALENIYKELMDLQPHIPQACIPGHEPFIDTHVDRALEFAKKALEETATMTLTAGSITTSNDSTMKKEELHKAMMFILWCNNIGYHPSLCESKQNFNKYMHDADVHRGDCTKEPQPCWLCHFEDDLKEYYELTKWDLSQKGSFG